MSTLKVNNIVAYSGTHVSGTFSGVFSGSFDSSRIDALEAFSSSLDSTFATDLVVNSLSGAFNSFTAALDNTYATDTQLYPILQATRSLELLSGSLIGITNGLMAFTAALDSTYATDAQLLPLLQATASLNEQTGSYATTGSNTFIGNQTITGSVNLRGDIIRKGSPGLALSSSHNAYIVTDAGDNNRTWTFDGTGGDTIFPNGAQIGDDGDEVGNTELRIPAVGGGYKTWTFNNSGKLTLPGEIVGFIPPMGYERVVLQPSPEVEDIFLFSIDQTAGTFNRAAMEMPYADEDKAVTLGFPHNNNTVGYIFNQGTDTITGTELNNALNIMMNSGNVKITALSAGPTYKSWTFGTNGDLLVPGNIVGAPNLATTGSNTFVGNQTITGSLYISSSIILPNHSSAPSLPSSGALYFNTTDFHFYGWDGGQWKQLDN